jgi:hypothetical protein
VCRERERRARERREKGKSGGEQDPVSWRDNTEGMTKRLKQRGMEQKRDSDGVGGRY